MLKQLAVARLNGTGFLKDGGYVWLLGGGKMVGKLVWKGEEEGGATYRHDSLGNPMFSHEFSAGGLEVYATRFEL